MSTEPTPGWITKVLTHKVTLIVCYLICGTFLVIVTYAMSTGAELTVSRDAWLTLKPVNTHEKQALQKELVDLKQRVQDLERTTINIGLLPDEIRAGGSPQEIVRQIHDLLRQTKDIEENLGFSFSTVSREITVNGTINTRLPPTSDRVRRLHKHIQMCLAAVGHFEGKITTEARDTYAALVRFQARNGLAADGILGRKTWAALTANYERLAQ